MNTNRRISGPKAKRPAVVLLAVLAVMFGAMVFSGTRVSANHPVLVEGNCDSPVPGTTIVTPGFCGDFDGDGRIGTAEDTDGADRIFGTINAALGPGTGAAAGTGANQNGLVRIVRSGRFAEAIYIGVTQLGPGSPGVANPGNVTLEAAPGVHAIIDAVLQGDPAGLNTSRQAGTGIAVSYSANGATRLVTLRNLTIRNYDIGIGVSQNTRINIEDCRLENNLNFGISLSNATRAVITGTSVTGTGFRIPGGNFTLDRSGILINQSAQAKIMNSIVSHGTSFGIYNKTANSANAVLYKVGAYFNDGGNVIGPTTICTDNVVCN